MSVFEKAKKYYPDRWPEERIRALVEAGKLTAVEYEAITGHPYDA